MTTTTNAVVYRRVSTQEQVDSGLGLEAQLEAAKTYAASQGWNVAEVYTDAGISGGASLDKCPHLIEAIDALRRGDVLLVAKRDRLGRDVYRTATIERLVERRGASVASADGTGNGDDPAAALMRRMVDAFAEYERALIGARTSAALQAKKARGESTGTAPYGYRAEDGKLRTNPPEVALIDAIKAASERGLSTRAIAAELASAGYTTRSGGPVHQVFVHRVLRGAA